MKGYNLGNCFLLLFLLATGLFCSCKKDEDEIRIVFNRKISYGSVVDFDGNEYKTITVGKHTWMAENLKTTHYSDGSPLTCITDPSVWQYYILGEYCFMDNDEKKYKETYGALYNYFAVYDKRNLCPSGWHIPSFQEWSELGASVGGIEIADDKLKEAGSFHWDGKNQSDNSIGFTALPGGIRDGKGVYSLYGTAGYWWTSTITSPTTAIASYINNAAKGLCGEQRYIMTGASVRCIKDEFSIKTLFVSDITQTKATCGGNIMSRYGNIVERGVCWSTKQNPTITDSKSSDGEGIGVYTSNLTGLLKDTTYYVRAYANNGEEIIYGNEVNFTTLDIAAPTLTTAAISNITPTTVTSGGIVSDDGGLTVTVRGVCWSTSTNPTIDNIDKTINGSGLGIFTSNIAGLSENSVYYLRAYATNSKGTVYGNEISFTTPSLTIPTIITDEVSIFGSTTATCGSIVNDYSGLGIIAKGVCWSTFSNPTIILSTKTNDGEGLGAFTSYITGLIANTTYYVKAYATNSSGTNYGNEVTFRTTNKATDIDGNMYNVVNIGTQEWMVENLKTTKYRDGSAIPYITDDYTWASQTSGAYCWYDNYISNKATYGALYNYYSVVDSRNLCPSGWHIPSNIEWNTLITFLGGTSIAGGKLKETSFDYWLSPNTGATNETGFTGLPGGFRQGLNGSFRNMGLLGFLWSINEYNSKPPWYLHLNYISSNSDLSYAVKTDGISIRCLKDQ